MNAYLVTDLSDAELRRRILTTWTLASEQERIDGFEWYSTARTFAIGLAERYGFSLEQACGILAALSPSTEWSRNLTLADTFAATGDCGHPYGDSIRKARRIVAGESPLDVLGGDKVRAFYTCLIDPSSDAVCVDRHAYDIAVGQATDDLERKSLSRKGTYGRIADAYRAVAATVGVSPHVAQAVTWLAWRAIKSDDQHLRLV